MNFSLSGNNFYELISHIIPLFLKHYRNSCIGYRRQKEFPSFCHVKYDGINYKYTERQGKCMSLSGIN